MPRRSCRGDVLGQTTAAPGRQRIAARRGRDGVERGRSMHSIQQRPRAALFRGGYSAARRTCAPKPTPFPVAAFACRARVGWPSDPYMSHPRTSVGLREGQTTGTPQKAPEARAPGEVQQGGAGAVLLTRDRSRARPGLRRLSARRRGAGGRRAPRQVGRPLSGGNDGGRGVREKPPGHHGPGVGMTRASSHSAGRGFHCGPHCAPPNSSGQARTAIITLSPVGQLNPSHQLQAVWKVTSNITAQASRLGQRRRISSAQKTVA